MTTTDIEVGPKLAEGKTKIIYAYPGDPNLAVMVHKDTITAGDGEKRDVLAEKGELSCRTTSACFRYLEQVGVPTHYVSTPGPRSMVVRRAEMLPIEWVARRLATGSYVRRTGTAEGTRFDPVVLEMFLKDDARHDPQITSEEAIGGGLCTPEEVTFALETTRQVFLALEQAWAEQGIQLVDLKIEFGRTPEGLVVADVIDNDSWRLWPGGKRENMLDKQVYRNLGVADAAAMADVGRRYAEVAQRAEAFGD